MRKTLATITLALAAGTFGAAPALGDISTTQQLPAAACNQGTMNAHNHIPETTGNGKTTPGHMAVPGAEHVTPCGHGG